MVVKSEKQYFLPMEVNTKSDMDFMIANGFTRHDIRLWKIGNRLKRVMLIPCTKEQYYNYIRPIWQEQKENDRKKKYYEEHGIQQVSVERLMDDFELDIVDDTTLPEEFNRKLLLSELQELLSQLEELDKQIMKLFLEGYSETMIGQKVGMSQKGVNKRKTKVIKNLKLHFLK